MLERNIIDKIAARLAELEDQMSQEAQATGQLKYRELVREHARLTKIQEKAKNFARRKQEAEEYKALLADDTSDAELKQLALEELRQLEKILPAVEHELMLELVPPDPNDSRNIIVEIRAGTGGNEASLFAGDLLRMYSKYAEKKGWKLELIDASPSQVGGFKEVIFSIEGDDIYRTFRYEGGIHRVQRVPVTEASGRIHTSTATVAVLPEAEDIDEIEIKPVDLRIDYYRASGPGGQHVNKTDSAVRITHLPTGLVAASQEERSQHKNRARAMRVLRSHLLAMMRRKSEEQVGDARRSQIGTGDRSERIRTYNFPQNRLTDHRINLTLYSLEKVMEGDLDQVLQAMRDYYTASALKSIDLNQLLNSKNT